MAYGVSPAFPYEEYGISHFFGLFRSRRIDQHPTHPLNLPGAGEALSGSRGSGLTGRSTEFR